VSDEVVGGLHPRGDGVDDVEVGQGAVGLEEHPDAVPTVWHLGEVVPPERELVRTQRREPLEDVRDVIQARRGVEVVPVDQPDSLLVAPHDVPGSRVADRVLCRW